MNKAPSYFRFGLLLAISFVFEWRALLRTLHMATQEPAYTHILLVLPISIVLLSLEWRSVEGFVQQNLAAGSALCMVAVAIGGLSYYGSTLLAEDQQTAFSMLAIVAWWIGVFLLCFGSRVCRQLAFPLCFLLLLIPAPSILLNVSLLWLQHGSAWVAGVLFWMAGVPIQRDGILLSLPNLDIEVAKECSGIRSSMMLVLIAMLFAPLFLRSWWRQSLLIAAAIPLSVAKNGFRIFVVAGLGSRVDIGYLDGRLHHQGGIVFFGMAVVMMVLLLWVLRETELNTRGSSVSICGIRKSIEPGVRPR